MIELKVYTYDDMLDGVADVDIEYYPKPEADKVIEELKDDCAYWKTMALKNAEDNVAMAKHRAEAFKRECHQKYKRCLAMAKECENEENYLDAIAPLFDTDKECWEYNSDYWFKWHKRWLAIAEKFKPNSTLQQKD